ncbi:MAG: transcription elongation factor GreA [Chloroflexi bacterium]|nr:transcription elongation factor GreA [Chloroflexota bacterium]
MNVPSSISLTDAVKEFLFQTAVEEREDGQQELSKFLRWCGRDRLVRDLTVPNVALYVEEFQKSSGSFMQRLQPLKEFLAYVREKGYTSVNLASCVRIKKVNQSKKGRGTVGERGPRLTREGHARLQTEMANLMAKRSHIADELRSAAADKDFRENAPYDAAREHQGKVEARIRELQEILRASPIDDEEARQGEEVKMGRTVILKDLSTGEEMQYTLVNPKEIDLKRGRISVDSPMGKALLEKREGSEVQVSAPAGTLRYRIEKVE